MSSWADEAESSCALADEEARRLYALDPQHELLRFWYIPPSELVDGEPDPEKERENRIAMKNRFWDRPQSWQEAAGVIVTTVVYANYYFALKAAREALEQSRVPQRQT